MKALKSRWGTRQADYDPFSSLLGKKEKLAKYTTVVADEMIVNIENLKSIDKLTLTEFSKEGW